MSRVLDQVADELERYAERHRNMQALWFASWVRSGCAEAGQDPVVVEPDSDPVLRLAETLEAALKMCWRCRGEGGCESCDPARKLLAEFRGSGQTERTAETFIGERMGGGERSGQTEEGR